MLLKEHQPQTTSHQAKKIPDHVLASSKKIDIRQGSETQA